MIQWTDELKKQYRTAITISVSIFIMAPIIYLPIVFVFLKDKPVIHIDLTIIAYVLLALSLVQPLLIPLIKKILISAYKKNSSTFRPRSNAIFPLKTDKSQGGSPMGLFTTTSIIIGAIVESIYIYGLAVFFMGGNPNHILYFYPIGIFWTIIHFPRKSHYEDLVRKVEGYDPVE